MEIALHRGWLEEALQARIDDLREDVDHVETELHGAQEEGTQELLARWRSPS